MPSTADLLPELEAACDKLLWRSESDYSIEVVVLPLGQYPGKLLAPLLANYPENSLITMMSLDDFFGQSIVERSWFDSRELAQVQRYRNLRDLLETTLENLQVYRIGEVEIDVYILGTTEDHQVLGVKTTVIET